MKNQKNSRKIAAGVLAAQLVLQAAAMNVPAFADEVQNDTPAAETSAADTENQNTEEAATEADAETEESAEEAETEAASEDAASTEITPDTPEEEGTDKGEPTEDVVTMETEDALTIANGTAVPSELAQGKFVLVKGLVTSALSNISKVSVGIYDVEGKCVTSGSVDLEAKTFDLSKLDSQVSFNKLEPGNYSYKVTVSNSANKDYTLVNQSFTVTGGSTATGTSAQTNTAADDQLTISGHNTVPDSMKQGSSFSIQGTVTSAKSDITYLTAGVYDASGKFVTGRTIAPKTKSYDIRKLDAYLSFNTLPAGKYIYAVIATNAANNNYALVNKTFSVTGDGTAQTPAATSDKLSITGGTTVPDTLTKGKAVAVKGTVSSETSAISALTVGVYDANGKFVTGKTIAPNAKSYDLSKLDSYVSFNTLGDGAYTYAVIASNSANNNYTVVSKKFTVGNGAAAATDVPTIANNTVVPDTLAVGKTLSVRGVVTSPSSNITQVTVSVTDAQGGGWITGKTVNINAKSYDLSALDAYVLFNKVPEGVYNYNVLVTNAANSQYAVYTKKFTVGNGGTVATDDKLTITGGTTVPSNLAKGKAVNVVGTVTSAASNISALTVGVYDANGKFVTGKTIAPNAKSYDLRKLDNYVAFNALAEGTYTYAVIASNSANSNFTLASQKFTVGSGSAAATTDKLTITGGTVVPDNLAKGKALNVTGTVTSASSNITALTVGVYDANGKFVTGRTIAPNAKSYDLKKLDNYVAFNTLAAGKYVYAVIASNSASSNTTLVSKTFTVGSGTDTSNTTDTLSITGGTAIPDTLAKGKALNVTGTVTSASSNITALTVGVYDANGKFVTGRTIAPNAKSYDLRKLDSYVAFNTLAEGKYVYAVIATNSGNTNKALVSKSFTVGNGGTSSSTSDGLSISGASTLSASINKGRGVSVTGTITSASSNIKAVTVAVFDANGKQVTGASAAPNSKTYNINRLDSQVRFDQLGTGSYTYKVFATNDSNSSYVLTSQSFTVK